MKRLDLTKCNFVTEHFVPNIIMDRNLYDDILAESGTVTVDIKVNDNSKAEARRAAVDLIKLLQTISSGYAKSIHGDEHGLIDVFYIKGVNKIAYMGANTVRVTIDIISLIYNEMMHMSTIKDAIAAGEMAIFPDSRNYLKITMNELDDSWSEDKQAADTINEMKKAYKETIMANISDMPLMKLV